MSHRWRRKDMSNIIAGVDENGTVHAAIAEKDENDVTKELTTIVVINLNYVWDAVNTKWVRMTQPS